jgi:FkbM family methyltransferase
MNITRYLARRFMTLRGKTIVHVGAHLGQEAVVYQKWAARKVIWIEAAPDLFAKLQQNLEQLRTQPPSLFARLTKSAPTEHIAVQALVAAEDGVLHKLNVYSNGGASNSIFLIAREGSDRYKNLHETGEVHEVPSRTLDGILAELGIASEQVDILVVDIQGAELLCFKGATQVLKTVRWIQSEVSQRPVYNGGVLLKELEPWLAERGFRRRSRVSKNHTDAIFERLQ